MKTINAALALAAAALLSWAQPLHAESAGAPRHPLRADGPSLRAARQLVGGGENGGEIFDGKPILRRENDEGLAILEEQKDIVLGTHKEGDGWSGSYYDHGKNRTCDSFHHDSIRCYKVPGRTVTDYGDRQKVAIVDRKTYVRHEAKQGAKTGLIDGVVFGAINGGAWAALGVLATAAAAFLGLGLVVAGVAIAAGISAHQAEKKPEVFTRDIVTHSA